jgi:starch-binding outer membrane protein SusE/F
MKKLFIYFSALALVLFAFACDSVEPTPEFKKSDAAFAITPSTTTVAASKDDATTDVITFTWNDPAYAVGLENSKFSIRVAEAGTNFAKFFHKDFEGVLSGSLTGEEINGMAMGLGASVGESIALDVMIVASQANNNETKNSNVTTITVIPFSDLGIAASSTEVVLTKAQADETAVTLNWTQAFKGFDAVKSYQLQYAKGGTDFANAVTVPVTIFSQEFKQKQLNDLALGYGIVPGTEGTIDFRVIARNELDEEVVSNIATVTVTPYATTFPPLYGMGEALKGWGPWPGNAVELTGIDYKKYETYAYFNNGKAFRFFEQLDWGPTSYNYPYFTTVDPLFENANDGDSNLKFVGTSGWYKVTVDLVGKTVDMEAADEPQLYMTGNALNGWSWDPGKPVKMTFVRPGVFTATADFSVESFRFFAQADWEPTSYNYPYFESVDGIFENANDGDSNLKYIGEPGSRTVVVDLNSKTVAVLPSVTLYATGAALNGWNWDNEVVFTSTTPGVYTATATLHKGETFRFFAQDDWGPKSYNYPYFKSVNNNFENAEDGDKNLRFIGETGEYKITVDLAARTVALQ